MLPKQEVKTNSYKEKSLIQDFFLQLQLRRKVTYYENILVDFYLFFGKEWSTYHQPYLSYIKTQEEYIIHNYKISEDGCYLLECKFPSNEMLDKFLEDLNEHANYKLSIVINKH